MTEMECPKDLAEWANSDPKILFVLYDIDLLPEQIHTKEQVCALRGFQFGWAGYELLHLKKEEPK